MSEEARNTERAIHSWNSDLKLRNSRVAFVSAGISTAKDLNPVIQKNEKGGEAIESSFEGNCRALAKAPENQSATYAATPDVRMSNMTLNDLQPVSSPQAKSEEGLDSLSKRSSVERDLKDVGASNGHFFTDLEGTHEPVHTGIPPPIMRRSPSPTDSDSSGEVIIFTGRRYPCNKGDSKKTSCARIKDLNGQETLKVTRPRGLRTNMATVIDDPVNFSTERRISSPPKKELQNLSRPNAERALGQLNGNSGPNAAKSGRRRRGRQRGKDTRDEGILDDYVANIRDGADSEAFVESSMLNQRDLGGSDSAEWQDEVGFLTQGRLKRNAMTNSEEWDSADLEDFDDLSTSSEALDNIERVVSKRERPSGVQYLVIGAGYTVDDARWFPMGALNIPGAEALIQEFEDKAELNRLLNGDGMSDASLTMDEQVAQDLQDDLDDQEDEEDLELRKKARMTDEQIARLLSKQEELGLGSNDLLLLDGAGVGTDSEEELQMDGVWERAMARRVPSRSKRIKASPSMFPSATVFADVLDQDPYNGFDIMDQQRPSLRKKPKGRRGNLSMELSDSEMEQSMQTAWEKDRTKKRVRKQEREELRAQGLLGKKNKPDLKSKYREGISLIEVKNEIKNFLSSSRERYVHLAALPVTYTNRDTAYRFHRWPKETAK